MRHVYQATALLFLSILSPLEISAQIDASKLSITNYQLLSTTRLTRTQSQYTYSAQLVNTGPALPTITATVLSGVSSIQVLPGLGNLHFPPVAALGQVTSTNTFTVIVDRTGDDSFTNLAWSFNAPVANAGPGQTVPIGSTANLDGSASTNPSGIGTLTFNWVFTSRPPGTSVVLRNATAVMPFFVPDVVGNYVLSLTVTNGVGTDTSTVTISTVSSKPISNAGPGQTVKLGSTVTLDGSQSHDPDGSSLTYAWTLISEPSRSSAFLTGATTVSPTFTADQLGTYIAQLIVSDANGSSTPSTVNVTTLNSPPVANAGSNQAVSAGAIVQLDGSKSTDVDGNPLTYKWSLITLPAGSKAVLSSSSIVNPVFTADVAGTYVAQLIVNDGISDSAPSTVTISTNQILAPTANAGLAQTLDHGSTVQLSGSGTDPQSLPLTYHWSILSEPAGSNAALSNVGIPNPTFVADLPGTYIVQLVVNNGTLNSPASTVTISSFDTAPVANAGPNQTVVTGAIVTLNGSGSSDAENDPLTYTWSLLSVPTGSSAALLSPNIVSPTFVADVAGTYVAQLIVNDGFKSSQPSTVTITASSNSIVLSPSPLNLLNVPTNLTVSIPSPAGASGQTVNIAVLDTTVVTAPSSVTIPQNATSATVLITPVSVGTTTILASAPGFRPGTDTVNVTASAISLSISSGVVGITRTVTGTVTLSGPAPSSGVNVMISASTAGVVAFPATVQIAALATSGTFTITGVAAGSTSITVSAPGYTSGSAAIQTATLGAITVQSNVTVNVGQTLPLNVTLISPAPAGGATVSLVSSDPTKLTVTPTITFQQGSTTPQSAAQVTGVGFGTATVTASAGGFTGDSKQVQVGLNVSLTPATSTMSVGSSQNLTVTLSGVAPAGGVPITLSSDNTSIATVPLSVTIGAGLSFATFQVNGVAPGSANITANSSLTGVASGTAKVNVILGIAITTSTLPAGVVGSSYSVTITASGGTAPYTFSATGLPAGLSIANGGQISGSPSSPGTGSVAITATDSSSPHLSTTVNLGLTVNPALSIPTASIPGGTVGVPYSATVTAAGGIPPYTFSATALPAGLTINAAGTISGTPTTAASGTAVVTVTDNASPHGSATANFPITIIAALKITTTTLPAGTTGIAYNSSLAASGGTAPYTFSATGLPTGLSISPAGAITGTVSTAGSSTVTATVTDSSATHLTATATLTLTINPPALSITTTTIPNGALGVAYSTQILATGGTPAYTFSATGLPQGLTISAGGLISGTPTAIGPSTPAITVTDSTSPTHLSTTANFTITINPPVLAISTTALPNGTMGTSYSSSVAATGGTAPYSFAATGLPAGLTMNSAGAITGTPTGTGKSTISVTVTDSTTPTHGTAPASLTITIAPPALAITTTTLPSGTVGSAYNATVAATGGTTPYVFAATGLPNGLSMNSSTGQITGSPTAVGTSSAVITVTDATSPVHQSVTATLTIAVAPAALTITTSTLPAGTVGVAYTATVSATGGTTPYSFSATGLPNGLTINTAGQISGNPTAPGTTTAAITVTDVTSPTHMSATANLAITIAPTALTITTTSLPGGTAGTAYTATVTAGGGTPPYSFSATGLPAALTMAANGQISGTPTAAGTASVVVTVTDQTAPSHLSTTATLSLVISPALTITTTSLPAGTVSVAYNATVAATGGSPAYTFSASGLPAGLTISAAGVISGTPMAPGTSTPTITVTDSALPAHKTVSVNLPITINPPPLSITNVALPQGMQNVAYTATLTAAGGTPPYNWSLTSGALPNGLTLNAATGTISGTPFVPASNLSLTFKVTDSGSPAQSASQATTLNIAASVTQPTALISGGTVGQNLQIPVTVTLSQAPASAVFVTVSSNAPGLVTLGGRVADTGTGSLTIQVNAGQTSFSLFAQGLASSGSAMLTASASGYLSSTSTVTLSPAGFVIAGPNGVGGSFTTNQGALTTLTVSAAQLDSSGNFVQAEQVRGGLTSVPVTLSNSASTIGTLAPSSLSFTSGTSSLGVQFTANPSQAGSTLVTVNVPTGFNTPASNANAVPITVQTTAITPSNVTVGANLENTATATLQGVAQNDLEVTLTSNNPTMFLLSPDSVSAGSASIMVKITAGHSATPPFFVYGIASSGTATYSATAPGFGSANGTVTLAPSGFVLNTPFGLGANFFTTTGTQPSFLNVQSALLDGSGNYVTSQSVAGGPSVTVSLTSVPGSVGTITPSVVFAPGSNSTNAQFQPAAMGTATLTAAPPAGFSPALFGTVTVTVVSPKITIDTGDTIGVNLQQQGTILIGAVAPAGGLQVTLSSDSPAALVFSATGTSAGTASVVITVPAGNTSATYFMQALTNSGTVHVTASAPGYTSGTGVDTLANSGVVIAGPFGPSFPLDASVSAGPAPITVFTAVLDSSNNVIMSQPLAGGRTLSVSLTNSNTAAGTIPSPTVTIPGVVGSATVSFTPLAAGQNTMISVTTPAGFTTPTMGASSLTVDVGN